MKKRKRETRERKEKRGKEKREKRKERERERERERHCWHTPICRCMITGTSTTAGTAHAPPRAPPQQGHRPCQSTATAEPPQLFARQPTCTTGTSITLSKNRTTTSVSTTLSKKDEPRRRQQRACQQPCPRAARPPQRTPRPRARQQPCPRTARRRPPRSAPNPAPSVTDVIKTVASLSTGLWGSAGAWVTLPKESTPDGQVLRATTPEGVSPIIRLVTLDLQTPGS